ncbi:TPA: hypothetical protein DEG21_03225 [Patescibacteria group bacterium]|nr:hypothetical protein [Candidatus Gracilibacteria bacterium]HBY74871.1 hypothetical protein [Candidatus Gracilibacteria bacterium]
MNFLSQLILITDFSDFKNSHPLSRNSPKATKSCGYSLNFVLNSSIVLSICAIVELFSGACLLNKFFSRR